MSYSDVQAPSNSSPPLLPPEAITDSSSEPDSTTDSQFSANEFSILHFNCKNSIQITHETLTHTQHSILALQEPWFNSHSLNFPHHSAWHCITAYDYNPSSWSDKPRVCLYITKHIPTQQIVILPSSSDIILAVDIKDHISLQTKIRIISWYNPPGSVRGFMTLKFWLKKYHQRHTPTILLTDSNLHHHIWNPPGYPHTDPFAKKLLTLCSSSGFKLSSPKGVATRFSTGTHPTTIDLVWSSWNLLSKITSCKILTNGLSSDHLPIETNINLSLVPPLETHISFKITDIDEAIFHRTISSKIQQLPTQLRDTSEINTTATRLSDIILEAAQDQGKKVKTNFHKQKAWWNKEILNPILKNRNRARRWMLRSNLPEAHRCYMEWQKYFKDQVLKAKFNHWKSFLAHCSGTETFKALRFAKPNSSNVIAPLKQNDGSIATTKETQASMLYYGTSVAHADADLSDIPSDFWNCVESTPNTFSPLEPFELKKIVNDLPNRRAEGEDRLSNELIKLALPVIEESFCKLVNACFNNGFFPHVWRSAVTIIIRKHGKDDYSIPNSYRPIALLSCLGKILEKIITSRFTYWAETCRILAPGHMGGRRMHSTDDALLILTSWIKNKWRQGKIVSALLLDVKSAYPSVHRDRLWYTLYKHHCPPYLLKLIHGFLSERTTTIRLQDFLSDKFQVDNGLPQGSPLSVILYIVYNSDLLKLNSLNPSSNEISLGFIDDVVHLVSSHSVEVNLKKLEDYASRTLSWGNTHGAIFDKKKAQLIHFTNKQKLESPDFHFGEVTLKPQQVVKWLGVWFDTKLLFNHHLQQVKKAGEFSIHQLHRLSKCYTGLPPVEVKKLVNSVLLPRILYGSIAWLTERTLSKANRILVALQHSAQRLILGAFRGTSSEMLEHDALMLPFGIVATKRHHNFLLKRLASPEDHPSSQFIKYELNLKSTKHKGPVQDVLSFEFFHQLASLNVETIYAHSLAPWTKPLGSLHNLELTKDTAIERVRQQTLEEDLKESIVIFTDGSFSSEGGGAAAVSKSLSINQSISHSSKFSNHEAELVGIKLAAQLANQVLKRLGSRPAEVAIFSDNQGVLSLIHDTPRASSGQHLVLSIRSAFRALPNVSKIRFYWSPGHVGIDLNEHADALAKEATTNSASVTILPSSLGSLKREVKINFNVKNLILKPGKFPYRTKPLEISKSFLSLERGRTAVIFQLRAGHSPLNAHLFKRKLTDSPLCSHCKKNETTEHFLLYCSRYTKARRSFRSKLREEEINVNWNNATKLLDSPAVFLPLSDFILETKRFVYFTTYLQDRTTKKGSRRQN